MFILGMCIHTVWLVQLLTQILTLKGFVYGFIE